MTNSRPRIALVLFGAIRQHGGIGTSVLRLARGLSADGRFDVDVVGLRPAPDAQSSDSLTGPSFDRDPGIGFFELLPDDVAAPRPDRELVVQQALVALARRRRYTLLHGFSAAAAGFYATLAAAECGIPSVVGVRGNEVYGQVFEHARLPRLLWAMAHATHVIAVSEVAARRADMLTGCGPRTTVVLNTIDPAVYRSGTVGVPGSPVIGTLGRLTAGSKGVDLHDGLLSQPKWRVRAAVAGA
ncbi:glycosyltransferase [Streptomyces sp. NPDC048665]|uniref:glycosyltransferase n=1 Tax=Streptomyces sp. NPDC048665 TaxID=3155490 RepID=UPI0034182C6B